MVMHYKSMELTGLFPRSQGASEGRQQPACHRYAGMTRGAECQTGRRAIGGRQARIRLVCRQTADGRPCAQIRHAVSLLTQVESMAARQAGRRTGSRQECRLAKSWHAGLRQASDRWQAVKKTNFVWCICGKGVIPTNLNILFHFGIVTIFHEISFRIWDVPVTGTFSARDDL
jgi:hypothetical protein